MERKRRSGKVVKSFRLLPMMFLYPDTVPIAPTICGFGPQSHPVVNLTLGSLILEITRDLSVTNRELKLYLLSFTPTITLTLGKSLGSSNNTSGWRHLCTIL